MMRSELLMAGAVGCLVGTAAAEAPMAGTVVVEETSTAEGIFDYVKPTVDVRGRYENVDTAGLNEAWAATLRSRLGLLLRGLGGFSAFVEYEGTVAADRTSYQAASVHGVGQGKSIIADPESHEVNQLWVAYEAFDTAVKVGRQRLILDNARFVGNVGWRQNEQTFDAVTVTNTSIDELTLRYGYVSQVNRIFGSEFSRNPGHRDFDGNTHLMNISYSGLPFGTLTGYGYLMDLGNDAGHVNSNQTFGASLKGAVPAGDDLTFPYYLEYAYQQDAFDSPLSYEAHYVHGKAAGKYRGHELGFGYEILGSGDGVGFKTPLATAHAFNGFNDVFLATPATGLEDAYVYGATELPFGVAFKVWYHWFSAQSGSGNYGEELDVVLAKKFKDHFSVLGKFANYDSSGFGADERLYTIEFGFKF